MTKAKCLSPQENPGIGGIVIEEAAQSTLGFHLLLEQTRRVGRSASTFTRRVVEIDGDPTTIAPIAPGRNCARRHSLEERDAYLLPHLVGAKPTITWLLSKN